jgi:phosphatidylserine/phosphatidylglycerophosphate/cardiolipin synthase-like enzyme
MNKLDNLTPIIQSHLSELKLPGVISVRPGYKLVNDWPSKDPAIVVTLSPDAPTPALPAEVEGVPVDIRTATDVEQLRAADPETYGKLAAQHPELRTDAFPETDTEGVAAVEDQLRAVKEQVDYSGPDGVSLQPVSGQFAITCHASPDAGWPTLKTFLSGTQQTLTVAMYDFTSAHILESLEDSMAGSRKMSLVLDHPAPNPTRDQTDEETIANLQDKLDTRLDAAWALVKTSPKVDEFIYPNAYHIKVAVRDSKVMWLSSGNWNNSNQPDMDPIGNPSSGDQALARKSDRDWHVVIENADLAKQYEAFIKHDLEVAAGGQGGTRGAEELVEIPDELRRVAAAQFEFHPPLRIDGEDLRITPLLTPDPAVYQPAMLNLIQSAQHKLYIQLQYIHPSNKDGDEAFNALIEAVGAKIDAGVDVCIILSQFQDGQWLDRLQAAGVDLSKVKIQNGVHNKGFVIDGATVALGSQNWSGDGVLRNRDASVVIESATAAQYYEQIFVHDWTRVAKQASMQAGRTREAGA